MFGHTAGDFGPCQGSWAVPFSHVAGSRGRHMVAGRGQQKDPKETLPLKIASGHFPSSYQGRGVLDIDVNMYILCLGSPLLSSPLHCVEDS